MNKKTLRKTYLDKRKTLSEENFHDRNQELRDLLRDFQPLKDSSAIHIFLSIPFQKEPDTRGIIDDLRKMGKKIIVPRIKGNDLEHIELTRDVQLVKNRYGILEPIDGQEFNPGSIDLVLIPMVICDKKGNRIGYGKGYYDAFLAENTNMLKVGMSLSPPLDEIAYSEAHDVKLDYCITPYRIYDFRATGSSSNSTSN